MTITSGINSIAHAVEALYSVDANPITSNLALQGIGAIARSLPVLLKEPSNVDARSKALFGAWCGGTVLGAVGMSLHHKVRELFWVISGFDSDLIFAFDRFVTLSVALSEYPTLRPTL